MRKFTFVCALALLPFLLTCSGGDDLGAAFETGGGAVGEDGVTPGVTPTTSGNRAHLVGKFLNPFPLLIGPITYSIALGDVDGDGDLDLVTGGPINNSVWFNDGCGSFTFSGQVLGNGNQGAVYPSGTWSITLGDVDGDGDLDMVEGNIGANRVLFNNGKGSFTYSEQTLGGSHTNSIALGDVDGDGDLDMVEGNKGANSVWLNDGTGYYTNSGQILGSQDAVTTTVALGDVDGDGDLDMVEGNNGQANRLWMNDGNGNYTDSGQILGNPDSDTVTVALSDVDGDGDIDLVEGNHLQSSRVYMNDGEGIFIDSAQELGFWYLWRNEPEKETNAITLGDFDEDGDVDLYEMNGSHGDRILINDGRGVFTDSGQEHLGIFLSESVAWGDMDGDGDPDIVKGNWNGVHSIYLNNGRGIFTASCQGLSSMHRASFGLGDLNGDGALDIPRHPFFNDGNGNFYAVPHLFHPPFPGESSPDESYLFSIGDLDGDGDLDLVESNTSHGERVLINDGSGIFTVGQILPYPAPTVSVPARSIKLGDLDGDGDLDLVRGYVAFGDTLVYFNNGLGEFTYSGQALDIIINSLALGDVDNDGDLDLVSGQRWPGGILIWFNDGHGTFTDSGQILSIPGSENTNVELGDVDGDGDLDMVEVGITFNEGGYVGGGFSHVWFNNGSGTFTDSGQNLVDGPGAYPSFAALGDLDGDGDLDLVANERSDLPCRVFWNNGLGVFDDSGQALGERCMGDVSLADVEGDGDLDIVNCAGNFYINLTK